MSASQADSAFDRRLHPLLQRTTWEESAMSNNAWWKQNSSEAISKAFQEGTVDAYDEHEQCMSLFHVIDEELEFPFAAMLAGDLVSIVGVEQPAHDPFGLDFVFEKGGTQYAVAARSFECIPTGQHLASVDGFRRSKSGKGLRLSKQSLLRIPTWTSETAFAQAQNESGQAENLLCFRGKFSAIEPEQKPLRFWCDLWSRDRLHVRTHHVRHSTDFGGFPDFIVVCFFPVSTIAERFDGNIQPDLVPVLETIGYRFGGRVNRDFDAFNFPFFNTIRKRLT
jgi:hypothetical protein